MSKTTQTKTEAPTPNPFTMDPRAILEAQRQATLTGIEGLISMQTELRSSFDKGMSRVRTESDSWAKTSNDMAAENVAGAFDLANRALSAWRDEVARFGTIAKA
ncbi:MAG: hypothetical protein KDA24_24180 [Deltaproteobacteria bacterium]|nr:hypothetical protein [Deltaproteobacteria bacterium]